MSIYGPNLLMTMSKPKSSGRDAAKDIISGTAGGVAQVVAGHPLDTIKVRLQTQVLGPDGKFPFAGMRDCARQTFHKEGFG